MSFRCSHTLTLAALAGLLLSGLGVPMRAADSDLVPLKLKLPSPVFAGTPKEAPPGITVETMSPSQPLMVPRDVRNIAPGSRITSSDRNATSAALAKLTDGDKEAEGNSIVLLRKGLQWVQFDLGGPHQLFAVVLWHAHDAPKIYCSVIVQTADDADFTENVRTLFNNDSDNSAGLGAGTNRQYFETFQGKTIDAKGTQARYLRLYSHGSTDSALNEYTEVEIYGRDPGGAAPVLAASADGGQAKVPTFQKIQLTDKFWSEGAAIADFNHDGKMDIVAGPFWYEGPDFKKRHTYYPANHSFHATNAAGQVATIEGFEGALGVKNAYSDDFLTFTADINGDGWTDIVVVGFPGKQSYWYENPQNKDGLWPQHVIIDSTDDESPTFGDLLHNGKPALICLSSNYVGYATPDAKDPAAKWTFHRISPPKKEYQRFTHGLGFGDVNGDGRNDILLMDGWYEQPASLEGDPVWKFHPYPFATIKEPSAPQGSSQMYAYDVNGDGLPDVITALSAHGFGLAWYEQLPERDANGEIQFKQHLILNPDPTPNKYGVAFSQPHGIALADINGDGLMDIVTGKRFWAHGKNGADPQTGEPAVLYWFQLVRGPNHTAEFVPHLIDTNSGVGTEVVVGDVNGDGRPDIIVGNKKGTFIFLQQ